MAPPLRILYVDAYDSFSNNIIAALTGTTGAQVTRIRIDTKIDDFAAFLKPFSAVVCGPGPGHPARAQDVGIYRDVWTLSDTARVPVLGICLGFQSLVLAHGGGVQRLARPRHGVSTCVVTADDDDSIFAGLGSFESVQYHSLEAVIHDSSASTPRTPVWTPTSRCPQLVPLAWDVSASDSDDDSGNPTAILMGVRHATKPFWGIQFHPESICSSDGAAAVLRNWWSCVVSWTSAAKHVTLPPPLSQPLSAPDAEPAHQPSTRAPSSPRVSQLSRSPSPSTSSLSSLRSDAPDATADTCNAISLPLGPLTVPSVCAALGLGGGEFVLLDSEMRLMDGLGQSSIVGLVEPDTLRLEYSVGDGHIVCRRGDASAPERVLLAPYGGLFGYLKAFMAEHARTVDSPSAFAGGLMGYIGYEAGLETIGVPARATPGRPDVCFAFVQRSVVLDHKRQRVFVQSIHPEDEAEPRPANWVAKAAEALHAAAAAASQVESSASNEMPQCTFPQEATYKAKIAAAQEHIRAGDSYELCLTDQTEIQCKRSDGWQRYLRMRRRNPAPFAAYVRLGGLTLLSTSPERFMSWSRPAVDAGSGTPHLSSTAQFRPIKGTVQKRPPGSSRAVTHAEAAAQLATRKERAENLMIVDLIRHDLHGVAARGAGVSGGGGSGGAVRVPRLMAVEEYATVFQLVSVVEGELRSEGGPGGAGVVGLDALAASLPPGSMTGAPKRRSCELLRRLEAGVARSVYAGVLGYACVSGKGDFSVVIRSAWRWDGTGDDETWRIGAGGAVVDLSTEQGEWDEMLAKLSGALDAFAPGAAEGLGA